MHGCRAFGTRTLVCWGIVPWEALWLPRGIGSQTWNGSLLGRRREGGVRSVVRRAGVSWVGDAGEGRGRGHAGGPVLCPFLLPFV